MNLLCKLGLHKIEMTPLEGYRVWVMKCAKCGFIRIEQMPPTQNWNREDDLPRTTSGYRRPNQGRK